MSQYFEPPAPANMPAARPSGMSGFRPKSHMVMAAFSLLGIWPLAIVAIICASSVHRKWDEGDTDGAMKAARQAKRWAIASWCVAAVLFTVVLSLS